MNSGRYSNYKIVWENYKLESMADFIHTFPQYIRIKPTNKCNHNCYYCVYDTKYSGMHDKFNRNDEMPSEILSKLIKNLHNNGIKTITFSGGGEPLLHPAIEYALLDARELRFNYSIITNGQLLSGKKAEYLRSADWVRISANYYNVDDFIDSSRGLEKDYETVINNITDFAASKNTSCELSMNYVVTRENNDSLFKATEFWKSKGIETIRFSPMWTKNFTEYHSEWHSIEKAIDELSKFFDSSMEIQNGFKIQSMLHHRLLSRCYYQEICPVVGADCNVYRCHNSAYTDHGFLGSIKEKSFYGVWFSKELEQKIKTFLPSSCDHQCAAGKKNLFIEELMQCRSDTYV